MNTQECLPINQKEIEMLLEAGVIVDFTLKFSIENKAYKGFIHYNDGAVIRQVYTKRKEQRCFKNLDSAIKWGHDMGLRSVNFSMQLSDYRSRK
ncbi:hypothetical protein [Pleionea sp. CnH1-48]|uniref:hypothetical protein n=1 Tax=Pleionea sp. CnH1-48 TaxID=2954494 RepID=UPI002096A651|nr:hypothetical protein [Pleionea sp. CnH1-48]MCO7226663.1 hypothetical protein [Pleionea sp. CnH1-48]